MQHVGGGPLGIAVSPDGTTVYVADWYGARLLRLQVQVAWGEGGPAQRLQVSSLRLVVPPVEGVGAP